MPRRNRQREQQLFFDQRPNVEIPFRDDRIEVVFFEILVGQGFARRDQQQLCRNIQRPGHGPKTTLALQVWRSFDGKHKKAIAFFLPSFDRNMHRTRRVGQHIDQPRKPGKLERSLPLHATTRKLKRVGDYKALGALLMVRHKQAMILFAAPLVKDRASRPRFMRPLVLASTSRYRRELLERFGLPFVVDAPDTDETPLAGEPPAATASRLAIAKARAVAARHPDALIIGSDQVASLGDERFGKPGTVEKAIAQLTLMRGRAIVFHTAVALLDTQTNEIACETVPTEVAVRNLSDAEIVRYVERERPLDCAGSAKSEALGITLLEHIRGDDPNALVGLPLIALARLLRQAGVVLP